MIGEIEVGFEGLFTVLAENAPRPDGVTSEVRTIDGPDGNEITLHIHRPTGVDGPLPCIYQVHGGGMVMLSAEGPVYRNWREELAAAGTVVVGVQYRNGAGRARVAPVPGRSQRLRRRPALGLRPPRRAGRHEHRRDRRLGRREPLPRPRAQGQAGGLAGRDLGRLRDVAVHLRRLGDRAAGAAVVERERRLLAQPRAVPADHGRVRPGRRERRRPDGLALQGGRRPT